MANNDDIDLDEGSLLQPPKRKRKLRPLILVLLSVAVGAGVSLYFAGFMGPLGAPREPVAEQTDPVKQPALYLALEPPFIVNFDDHGDLRYLQAAATVMSHDPAVIEAVTTHMPHVRNNLILLLGSQQYETLSTLEGKEHLRGTMLEEVSKVLKEATGKAGPESVYFTSFVMQ